MIFTVFILVQLQFYCVSTRKHTARTMSLKKAYVKEKKWNMYDRKHRAR